MDCVVPLLFLCSQSGSGPYYNGSPLLHAQARERLQVAPTKNQCALVARPRICESTLSVLLASQFPSPVGSCGPHQC